MAEDVSPATDKASPAEGAPARQPAGGNARAPQAVKPAPGAPQRDRPAADATLQSASADKSQGDAMTLDAVRNIPVTLTVVLGSLSVPVSELMSMQRGKTIALDKKVGEPVDILANGKLIARGEIVVLEEDEPVFAVSVSELVAAGATKAQ